MTSWRLASPKYAGKKASRLETQGGDKVQVLRQCVGRIPSLREASLFLKACNCLVESHPQ